MRRFLHPVARAFPAMIAMAAAVAHAADPPAVGPRQIGEAIKRASDFLVRQQKPDGSWEAMNSPGKRVGGTGLVLLALANAGLKPDDPPIRRGLEWLRRQRPADIDDASQVYQVSLQTMALAMLAPEADRPIIAENVRWLQEAQLPDGSWSYTPGGRGSGDNSNAQFAVLALHEAARAGVAVDERTWTQAAQYWASCANDDGSWGYSARNAGTGSMTCAGIASIWITAEHLGGPAAAADGMRVVCCSGGSAPVLLERGLDWLGRRFSVLENPGAGGGGAWLYYYLYGLERVGRFTARRYIGEHDWYREGAAMFVAAQDFGSGSFKGGRVEGEIVSTSFALLFLAKGRRPVIVGKSRHGPGDDWNRHGHDIAHLVEYVEGRWKKDYPAGLSWHVADTPTAEHGDLMQAPVLWISGSEFANLGPGTPERLRAYVDAGGFVFAEACCPQSAEFDRRIRQLVGEMFPEPEYRLNLLPPEHPAWHAEEIVPPGLQRPLLGVDYGCRTCLIYAPPSENGVPSLSCLWELGGPARERLPDALRQEVDAALTIGANVLAYATNREVKGKDELFDVMGPADRPADPVARGQLAIGKLRHAGLCDAAPGALANILRAAARERGVHVDDTPTLVDPGDESLFDYHMVFMHGRQGFVYDDPRRRRLAEFLERGGTLLADSICASPAFTEAFRREIAAIMPGRALEVIPADDPMFSAAEYGGYDIREVTLREPAGGDGGVRVRKRTGPPVLEGIRIGDRWAVIFSPYDLSCALEKQNSLECAGYDREDAERIALNILLYSLNQ